MVNKPQSAAIPLALRSSQCKNAVQLGTENRGKHRDRPCCLLELSWNLSLKSTPDHGEVTGEQGQTILRSQLVNGRASSFHNVSGGDPGEQVQLPERDRCKIHFQWKYMFNEEQWNFAVLRLDFFATCISGYM